MKGEWTFGPADNVARCAIAACNAPMRWVVTDLVVVERCEFGHAVHVQQVVEEPTHWWDPHKW